MRKNEFTMIEIQENESIDINGGLLGGAIIGGILGAGIVGMQVL